MLHVTCYDRGNSVDESISRPPRQRLEPAATCPLTPSQLSLCVQPPRMCGDFALTNPSLGKPLLALSFVGTSRWLTCPVTRQ